jgi:dethiobiotin synthetase/adenosylmethionine--8-amino-7-oxononanoate aminotransferase
MCLKDPYYRNEDFLRPFFEDRGVGFWAFEKPHERGGGGGVAAPGSVEEDVRLLDAYYTRLDRGGEVDGGGGASGEPSMRDVARVLEEQHYERIRELESMPKRTLESVWWPFTQHGMVSRLRPSV